MLLHSPDEDESPASQRSTGGSGPAQDDHMLQVCVECSVNSCVGGLDKRDH